MRVDILFTLLRVLGQYFMSDMDYPGYPANVLPGNVTVWQIISPAGKLSPIFKFKFRFSFVEWEINQITQIFSQTIIIVSKHHAAFLGSWKAYYISKSIIHIHTTYLLCMHKRSNLNFVVLRIRKVWPLLEIVHLLASPSGIKIRKRCSLHLLLWSFSSKKEKKRLVDL